jgi:hypothetical protein
MTMGYAHLQPVNNDQAITASMGFCKEQKLTPTDAIQKDEGFHPPVNIASRAK